jgi:hypothetical protein
MGDVSDFAKRTALAGLFCLSALGVMGQKQSSSQPVKQKNDPMGHMSFLLPLTCLHSDPLTPYRQFPKLNLGLLGKYNMGDNWSLIQGGYNNSNYGLTETAGMIREWKLGRLKLGLIAGVAMYPVVEHDRSTYTLHYGPTPEDVRQKGLKITNLELPGGRYLEIRKEYRAHGLKNKWRLLPVIVGTATLDAFSKNSSLSGSGPFAIFSYMPWKSGEKQGLGIAAVGAQICPNY